MGADSTLFWVAAGSIATAIMAILITVTLIVQVLQTNNLKNQTLFSNFSILTQYTGDPETRKNRRIIYKFYRSPPMADLLKEYPNQTSDELKKLEGSLKQIGAMYERVAFLLSENNEMKNKFREYHGFTTGVMWKIYEPFNKVDIDSAKSKGYTYFVKLGEEFYLRWRSEIDEFLAEKEKKNKDRNTITLKDFDPVI